jgi:hypothetical protein
MQGRVSAPLPLPSPKPNPPIQPIRVLHRPATRLIQSRVVLSQLSTALPSASVSPTHTAPLCGLTSPAVLLLTCCCQSGLLLLGVNFCVFFFALLGNIEAICSLPTPLHYRAPTRPASVRLPAFPRRSPPFCSEAAARSAAVPDHGTVVKTEEAGPESC